MVIFAIVMTHTVDNLNTHINEDGVVGTLSTGCRVALCYTVGIGYCDYHLVTLVSVLIGYCDYFPNSQKPISVL